VNLVIWTSSPLVISEFEDCGIKELTRSQHGSGSTDDQMNKFKGA
jgi:hypothetical protein